MTTTHTQPRRGFTLIEMLVVIAILVILVGLTAAGVMRFYSTAIKAENRNEMLQLTQALESFKQKYGIYPPSRILLSNRAATYADTSNALAQESLKSLIRIWPNAKFTTRDIEWTGTPSQPYSHVLEGDQCLVFFLGGVQDHVNNQTLGFTDSPSDPILKGTRQKPLFNFKPGRLYQRSTAPRPFFSYKDAHEESPWVYFSSGSGTGPTATYGDHCVTLNVYPYARQLDTTTLQNNSFFNPKSFQLISAGEDGKLGLNRRTSTAPPAVYAAPYNPASPNVPINGEDDVSNFHPVALGFAE